MSRSNPLRPKLAPLALALSIATCPLAASAAINASFSGGELTVGVDAGENLTFNCQFVGGVPDPTGQVLINGTPLDSLIPGGAQCGQVLRMVVSGDDAANSIVLPRGSVSMTSYPNLVSSLINGGGGDDDIAGSFAADEIVGGPGADRIRGGEGDDTFVWNPGDGTDSVEGEAGNDRQVVQGGAGADPFFVTPGDGSSLGDVTFSRNPGFDIFITSTESLAVFGNDGDDTLDASALSAGLIALELNGGDGNDTIIGSAGDDLIDAGAGDDSVDANPGADTINLGDGNNSNIWNPGDGTDSVQGGSAGNDRQIVQGGGNADPFFVEPGNGTSTGDVRFFRDPGFEIFLTAMDELAVFGNGGDDTLDASAMPAGLIALELNGGDGNDLIIGSAGDDLIAAGAGDDTVDANPGADTIDLGDGNDSNVWNPGDGTDSVQGGSTGIDRQIVQGGGNADPFFVEPGNGTSTGDVRFFRDPGFEIFLTAVDALAVFGNGGDDTLDASALPAGLIALELSGGDGNDTIIGSAGDDLIDAGAGDDTADANQGNDRIVLGEGDDVNTWNNGDNSDEVFGDAGSDRQIVNGAPAGDEISIAAGSAPFSALFARTNLVPFTVDMAAVETLEVNAGDGADTVNTVGLADVAQFLNGGGPNLLPGDFISIEGFDGSLATTPIVTLPGAQPIAHSGFENAGGTGLPPSAPIMVSTLDIRGLITTIVLLAAFGLWQVRRRAG